MITGWSPPESGKSPQVNAPPPPATLPLIDTRLQSLYQPVYASLDPPTYSSGNLQLNPYSLTPHSDHSDHSTQRPSSYFEGPFFPTQNSPQSLASGSNTNTQNTQELEDDDQETGRGRISLACRTCRARKIRCDGQKPKCKTCVRRKADECIYDEVVKRRGPDRHPRTRNRQTSIASTPSVPQLRKKPRSTELGIDVLNTSRLRVVDGSPSRNPGSSAIRGPRAKKVKPSDPSPTLSVKDPHNARNPQPIASTSTLSHSPNSASFPNAQTPPFVQRHEDQPYSRHSLSTAPLSFLNEQLSPSSSASTSVPTGVSHLLSSLRSNPQDAPSYGPISPHDAFPSSHAYNIEDSDSLLLSPRVLHGTSNPLNPDQVLNLGAYTPYGVQPGDSFTTALAPSPVIPGAIDIFSNLLQRSPRGRFEHTSRALVWDQYTAESRNVEVFQTPVHDVDGSDDDYNYEHMREAQTPYYGEAMIVPEPSLDFSRKMWWETLVTLYGPTREVSSRKIQEDVSHLFRVSNYFIACINVPRFMSIFYNPVQRECMQPALVLSALALSTFMKSSELELGHQGRMRALWLRTAAQSALEASVNANWITPGLAQAALILAIFEVSAHPYQSAQRSNSSLILLDSIIKALGLMSLDRDDPRLSRFSPNTVPVVDSGINIDILASPTNNSHEHIDRCSCLSTCLTATTPSSLEVTPFWRSSAGWDLSWSVAETVKEEYRRLVWCASTLGVAHMGHAAALNQPPLDLALGKPHEYEIFFPGETLYTSQNILPPGTLGSLHSPKHTVWALYARSQLLFVTCLQVRYDAGINDVDKASFAVQAWLETEKIERTLDAHTCGLERQMMYHGREHLFNIQMFVSSKFSRYVPHPMIGNPRFNRAKAEKWLNHQRQVASMIRGGLHLITGMENHVLAKRPYFVFWFMSQIARYLSIWSQDHSLVIALESSKSLIAPIEYLSSIFPCDSQRQKYLKLHHHLLRACMAAGIEPPMPPNFILAAPAFL